MLKDNIDELKTAMEGVMAAEYREMTALSEIIRRLGYEQAREILRDFAIILETKDGMRVVRRDWEMFLEQN